MLFSNGFIVFAGIFVRYVFLVNGILRTNLPMGPDTSEMIFNPEQAYLLMPHNPAIRTASDEPDTSYDLNEMAGSGIPAFKMMPADGEGPEADLILLNNSKMQIRGYHDKRPYPFKRGKPYVLTPYFAEDTDKARKKMKRLAQVFA